MTEENDKIKIEKEDKSHQPISSPHSSSDYSRVNSRPRPPTPSDTIREKYEKVEKSEEKEKSRPPSPTAHPNMKNQKN